MLREIFFCCYKIHKNTSFKYLSLHILMSNYYYYYYIHFLIRNMLIWYVLNDSFSLDFVNEFLTFFKVFLIFYFSFIDFSFLSLRNKILHLFFINFLFCILFIKYQCIFFHFFSSNKIFFAYTLKDVKGW